MSSGEMKPPDSSMGAVKPGNSGAMDSSDVARSGESAFCTSRRASRSAFVSAIAAI